MIDSWALLAMIVPEPKPIEPWPLTLMRTTVSQGLGLGEAFAGRSSAGSVVLGRTSPGCAPFSGGSLAVEVGLQLGLGVEVDPRELDGGLRAHGPRQGLARGVDDDERGDALDLVARGQVGRVVDVDRLDLVAFLDQ